MTPRLFHVSDDPGIKTFEPRVHPTWNELGPRVWAIEERLLHNYLLPRDCPRVTFYASERANTVDIETLLGKDSARHAVFVEEGWLDRIKAAKLFLYEFDAVGFEELDRAAGYWVAREQQAPIRMSTVGDPLKALGRIHFKTLQNLWDLSDRVAASSLEFSCIRMRNAQPRPEIAEMAMKTKRLSADDQALAEAAVCQVHGRQDYSQEAVRNFLADPANLLVIAEVDGIPVGSLNGYALRQPHKKGLSYLLCELDVADAHRRKGIAKELVREFVRIARAGGALEVWVLTNASNNAAMATYAACGFARENRDDVMMSLTLGQG